MTFCYKSNFHLCLWFLMGSWGSSKFLFWSWMLCDLFCTLSVKSDWSTFLSVFSSSDSSVSTNEPLWESGFDSDKEIELSLGLALIRSDSLSRPARGSSEFIFVFSSLDDLLLLSRFSSITRVCGVIVVALDELELELDIEDGVSVTDPRELTPLVLSLVLTRGETVVSFLPSISPATLLRLSSVNRLRFACLKKITYSFLSSIYPNKMIKWNTAQLTCFYLELWMYGNSLWKRKFW